jgi:four helix bundle protein
VGVRRYQDLECFQLSNELKLKVYAITRTPPASRDLEFCDQLRRAARSAASNIAEGFARFRPADFARFLVIARSSLVEVQVHLNDGVDLGYFEGGKRDELEQLASRAIGAATNLILYLRSCPPNR